MKCKNEDCMYFNDYFKKNCEYRSDIENCKKSIIKSKKCCKECNQLNCDAVLNKYYCKKINLYLNAIKNYDVNKFYCNFFKRIKN
jgi:hypothetical protein